MQTYFNMARKRAAIHLMPYNNSAMEQHERLKQARQMAGYDTASAAARRLNVPVPAYLAHENRSRRLRQNVAQKYARAFGVSLSWLLLEEGEPNFKTQIAQPPDAARIVYDRAPLLEVIAAAFQCLADLDDADARTFAEATLDLAARHQAAAPTRRSTDLVRALAVSAARQFSRPKSK